MAKARRQSGSCIRPLNVELTGKRRLQLLPNNYWTKIRLRPKEFSFRYPNFVMKQIHERKASNIVRFKHILIIVIYPIVSFVLTTKMWPIVSLLMTVI